MKILNFKKFFWLVSLLAVFSFQLALAESEIPQNLVPLANELGCQTKEECAKAFDSNFEKGIELAEKYQVYSKEQSDIAQSYKQEVISKLSNITEENFEEEIVKIAKELLKKPNLAKTFQLDKDTVNAAETIVTEVKNAGVGVDICNQSAETLSREQLIGCLEASKKLAKKSAIVQKYIPKGVIEKTNMADMAASLDEALAKGDYPELGKTAEEAGQKCLKSGSESLASCDEIAQKFFGPEGVKELAAARARTQQAGDFYLKGLENLELVTSDGRKIAGKTAIKNACENAFETRDVKLARSCGEFAVKNGFTSQKEMDDSLKIFESMADKNINFDQCRSNPELCQEFIPEEHRKEFEGNKKIYEIMKSEAGFNPIECERGNVDFEIGRKCFEASQKALPKLKEIAADYPEVQRMVSEIEFGIKREGEQKQKGDDFGKFFSQQAGPGGCKNEQECFAYCNDPAHGAECISFGAKHEVFQGNEAVERYQKYNDILANPTNYNQTGQQGENGFNQGGQNTNRQTYPYPAGDNRGAYNNQNNFGGQGPSPECFAVIQSGDFAKAKEVCSIPANPYQYQPPQPQPPYQVNPNYQQSSAQVNRICPARAEFDCQSGYQKVYRTTPDGCGFSECVQSYSSSYPNYDEKERCYRDGGFWTGNYCDYQNRNASSYSSYSYSSYPSSAYSSYPSYSSCTSEMISLLGTGCHFMYNDSSNTAIYCNGEMTKSAKLGDTAAKDGCQSGGYSSYYYSSYPSSAYSSYTYIPPSGQKEQIWNSYGLRSWIRTDADLARIENLKQVCVNVTSSGGNIWMTGAGDYNSQDFGMPDEAKCRSWSSSASSYSSYNYSSYPSSAYSSYSYSSYPSSAYSSYSYSSYPSSAYSSYSYSSYPSSTYSSYSYSSYPSYSSCASEMISLLGTGCHYMYNDSSGNRVYCNGEMTKSAKLGDTAAKDGCQSGGSSSYSSYYYSSYPSSAYSSYNYPQCDWSSQYLKNSTQTCMPKTYCYDTANAEYNSSECQGVRSASSYSSYSYSSYPSSAYSSYYYSSYPSSAYSSYSPASSEAAYSSYSSAAYSSADYSTACSQAGGTWDGSYCQMPQSSSAAAYSSAAYSSYDPSSSCAQAGGTWDGSSCQMPNSGSSSSATQNPAAVGWLFGKIINFFSR